MLRVRVNERERKAFAEAAALAGLSISAWVRMALRSKATADLRNAGKDGGF